MKLSNRLAASAALTAAFVLGAAAPATAQATPVAAGGGAFVALNQEIHQLAFHVVELPDGTVRGHGVVVEPSSRAFVVFDITSYMFVDGSLAMAGSITMTLNAPPDYVVGATVFFAVQDEGHGSAPADASTGLTPLPPAFGNPTIQQIIAMIGGGPPPEFLSPLFAGNIRFH